VDIKNLRCNKYCGFNKGYIKGRKRKSYLKKLGRQRAWSCRKSKKNKKKVFSFNEKRKRRSS
jgi:hypothetical protein